MGGQLAPQGALRLDEDQRHLAVARAHRVPFVGRDDHQRTTQATAPGAVDAHVTVQRQHQLEGVVGVHRRLAPFADEQPAVAVVQQDAPRPRATAHRGMIPRRNRRAGDGAAIFAV